MELYERPFYQSDDGKTGDAGKLKKILYEIFDELDDYGDSSMPRKDAVMSSGVGIDLMPFADIMVREMYPFHDVVDDLMEVVESMENPIVRAGIIADRLQIVKECGADDMLTDAIGDDVPYINEAIEAALVARHSHQYCKEIVKIIPEEEIDVARCVASAIEQYMKMMSLLPLFPAVQELVEKISSFMDADIDDYFDIDDDDEEDLEPPSRETIFAAVEVPESRREEFMAMVREKNDDSPDGYKYSMGQLTRTAQCMLIEDGN